MREIVLGLRAGEESCPEYTTTANAADSRGWRVEGAVCLLSVLGGGDYDREALSSSVRIIDKTIEPFFDMVSMLCVIHPEVLE